MPLRRILRLLLAGLLAGTALLAPVPLTLNPSFDPGPWSLDPPSALADGPGDWPMSGHDPAHTGYNPDETQLRPPLRLKWSYTTEGGVYSPAVADGVVYVGSKDGKLYALDAATGALRWSYTTGGGVYLASPAVAGGVVYVGSNGGEVYALDAATGALRWFYTTGRVIYVFPTVAGGVVYVGSWDGKMYALEAATGALRWSYATGGEVRPPSPAVAGGAVYVGSYDGKVYALDAATGALRWSYTTGGGVYSPAVADGVAYVSSWDAKVYALEAATGALRWSYTTGLLFSSPAVAGGVVYAVTNVFGKVYALDAATGALKWRYTIDSEVNSSPAVANGVVYVGSLNGKVYALEAASGALRWSYTTGATVNLSPAVANGLVYVVSSDGKVYAFEGEPPPTTMLPLALYQAASLLPISWTVPLTWTGTAAASYDVQYKGGAAGAWTDWITATTALSTTFTGGQDGHTYSFRARATTTTGAVGDWTEPVSTTVDLTAPTGSLAVQGWSSPYISNTVTFSVSASDATSGLSQMQLGSDGQTYTEWETYASSRAYTLPAGTNTVYARFKDGAGNVSQPVSATVTVDTTPPSGTLTLNAGAAYANNRQVTAQLSASDDLSGLSQMAFSSDGTSYGDWRDYSTLATLTLTPGDGEKTLYARFQDRAGNASSPASDTIALDTTPPTTPAPDDGLTGAISSPTVTLQWPAASDALSGVERYYYKTDCGSETATSALSAATPTLPDGDHSFYVRARDQAGNYSPYGKHVFTIKATNLDSPDLYAPDSPTDRDRINVSGVGPAKTPIRLYLNCAYYGENQSGNYGAWQFQDVPLALGENVIVASIVDSGGGLSPISMPAVVVRLKTLSGSPIKSAVSLLTPSGGSVSAGRHALEVPAGALPGEAQVVVTPYGTEGAPPLAGKRSIGAFASIAARERGTGAPAQLQKAVRITLGYDPQALGGVLPSQLSVHYYDPDTFTWVALPSQVDTANRRVTAEASHFSDFALLADLPPMPVKVYLPLVPRAAGGW